MLKYSPAHPPRRDLVSDPLFAGPGEMRALCREVDWAATPLGPVSSWPVSLRTVVGIVLGSRNPMFLFWGPDLVQIYNDAYRPSLGAAGSATSRHPKALGMKGRDFWTDIWDAIGPQIEQVMTTGVATWHEDQYLPIERNGRLDDVWWTYTYGPVEDDDGRVNGVLVVCQETTQRVRAEEELGRLLDVLQVERARLADVFRRAPTFLAVLRGSNHVFELVNDAYYAIVGDRTLVGKAVRDAIPEVRGQGFVELLDRVLKTGEPYVGREMPVMLARTAGADPEQRFIDFVYQPLTEADGSISGIVAHGHDVTDKVLSRREVERLLAESEDARAAAETANQVKAQFLAVMSHELRTPLNAIGGYTELLQMGVHGVLADKQREFLDRIQQGQHHLLGLIDEVLSFAKLDTGAVHFDTVDVPVQVLLASAQALVAPQAQAKGLDLVIDRCEPGLTTRADVEKLRQILVNLLSNAVKFTPAGGRIDVSVTAADGSVFIHVRDSGIGIAADKLDAVFDPFVQLRSEPMGSYDGAGLGLAISRDFARRMGGDLTLESAPGRGSTFTVRMPAA